MLQERMISKESPERPMLPIYIAVTHQEAGNQTEAQMTLRKDLPMNLQTKTPNMATELMYPVL